VSLSKEAVALSGLMTECRSMMEPEARRRGIRMTFPQFEIPVFVTAIGPACSRSLLIWFPMRSNTTRSRERWS